MATIINWDSVEEKSSNYINEAGNYTLKLMSCEVGETANNNPKHTYLCKTQDGKEIKATFVITEKALFRYKMFVKALGLSTSGSIDIEALPKLVIGKKFDAFIDRQKPSIDLVTGQEVESKYFEIKKFEVYVPPVKNEDLPF